MSNSTLILAAEVLEKAAAYIEAVEAEKHASETEARKTLADSLKEKVAEATGQQLSDEEAAKLAASDDTVRNVIEKLAASVQSPDSLGGPSDAADADAPLTKKAAAAHAEDRFASWLTE